MMRYCRPSEINTGCFDNGQRHRIDAAKGLLTDFGQRGVIAIQEGHPEVSGLPVIRIVRGRPGMGFCSNSAGVKTPVEFHFEGGKIVKWGLEQIVEKTETLRTKNSFWWGVGLFAIGVILQVVGFVIGNKKPLTVQSSGP